LLRDTQRSDEACELLTTVRGGFSDTSDTPDLGDARQLLAVLKTP